MESYKVLCYRQYVNGLMRQWPLHSKKNFTCKLKATQYILKPIKNDQKMINNKSCDHRLGSMFLKIF